MDSNSLLFSSTNTADAASTLLTMHNQQQQESFPQYGTNGLPHERRPAVSTEPAMKRQRTAYETASQIQPNSMERVTVKPDPASDVAAAMAALASMPPRNQG